MLCCIFSSSKGSTIFKLFNWGLQIVVRPIKLKKIFLLVLCRYVVGSLCGCVEILNCQYVEVSSDVVSSDVLSSDVLSSDVLSSDIKT